MDRTDLGQGREENIKSGFKKIWESRAVDLRYVRYPCRKVKYAVGLMG